MRILQISDFHLRGDGKKSFRVVDTRACLEAAQRHLESLTQKPDIMVITGDLADSGDEHAYQLLYEALSPLGFPVYALPGNHDRRDRMKTLLKGWCPASPETDPYICFAVECPLGTANSNDKVRLLMLDTMSPGSHSGHIHPTCASWLAQELATHKEPTLLFMHHPPFETGLGAMDEPYENITLLWDILRQNPQVRLCCGHMHRPIFTQCCGLVALTAPSASMQIDLDISREGGDTFVMETAGYLLHDYCNGVWNSHVCQIHATPSFAGPYRFLDSVNPVEDD